MKANSTCSDEQFAAFDRALFSTWDCTPPVERDFRGLALRGPARVSFSAAGDRPRLVVAGTFVIDHTLPAAVGQPEQEIVLVAVDRTSPRVYSSTMGSDDPEPPEEGGRTPVSKGLVIQGYFNPELFELLELPGRAAVYDVHAALGPYRSNVLRVVVEKKK